MSARADLFAPAAPQARSAPRRAQHPAQPADEREHACLVCGEPASFGFGVALRQGRTGRWSCFAHRDAVEGMAG